MSRTSTYQPNQVVFAVVGQLTPASLKRFTRMGVRGCITAENTALCGPRVLALFSDQQAAHEHWHECIRFWDRWAAVRGDSGIDRALRFYEAVPRATPYVPNPSPVPPKARGAGLRQLQVLHRWAKGAMHARRAAAKHADTLDSKVRYLSAVIMHSSPVQGMALEVTFSVQWYWVDSSSGQEEIA